MKRLSDVKRIGFGAMRLAGPGIFGPPADPAQAKQVLQRAVELGVDHIDTSDYYGPYVVNDLIREALHPYPPELVLVTKVGARRDDEGAWLPAFEPDEIKEAVHDNLGRLGVERLGGVNLRFMDGWDGDFTKQWTVLADLQSQGLVCDLGLSNCTAEQVKAAQDVAPVSMVQNAYNVAHREDDKLIDSLAEQGIFYVPFFPLGGFSPLAVDAVQEVADKHRATHMQVALAWLLQRSPNILLIPGTSSVEHLEENLRAAKLALDADDLAALDAVG
ncbi:oxidoreductase [Nocardioides sp. T2.26MG-1]|uniref:oxidoreductase n=1 Tax=Nocardioides sp. T2.26MG-1 TaxID=3041166 RepID=UPI002477833A|nr:oxidoreductase [Nocardioides sp. T2.26MG-1]CAI9411907.1 Pyridoxine 4-dehydrogenase [Nocardioides sp. T2.26MG-1]